NATLAREPARALAAALDEGLATELYGEEGEVFDALLLDLGMLDALAARLELRAERSHESLERAAIMLELARLHAGPLADDQRAAVAYGAVLAADPTCEEAIAALEAWSIAGRGPESFDDPRRSLRELAATLSAIPEERDRHETLVSHFRLTIPG